MQLAARLVYCEGRETLCMKLTSAPAKCIKPDPGRQAMKLFAHIKMKIPGSILPLHSVWRLSLLPQHVQNLSVGLYSQQHVGDCDVLELAFLGVWKIDLETEIEMSKFPLTRLYLLHGCLQSSYCKLGIHNITRTSGFQIACTNFGSLRSRASVIAWWFNRGSSQCCLRYKSTW